MHADVNWFVLLVGITAGFQEPAYMAVEGSGPLNVCIALSTLIETAVTLPIMVMDVSTESNASFYYFNISILKSVLGGDYVLLSSQVIFEPSAPLEAQCIDVEITDDSIFELSPEAFTLMFESVNLCASNIGINSSTIFITDNDGELYTQYVLYCWF